MSITDLEIIVVGNGSPQDLKSILSKLPASSQAVHIHRPSNQGLSASQNTGIDLAKGRYLLFLDADDELIPCNLRPAIESEQEMIRMGYIDVNLDD